MKTTCLRIALVATLASLGGCSGSDDSQVAELPTAESLAATSISPATSATAGLAATATVATNGAGGKIEPFRNPFAPPKEPAPPPVPIETQPEIKPEPVPEIRQPGVPPKIRLVGFMNIGEPKVLVSYRTELKTLSIGDTLEAMKVVKIESPELTMLFEGNEMKLSLFDQAWQHEGSEATVSNNSRTQSRPRSTPPSPRSSAAPFVGVTTSQPPQPPSDIPGFGPDAGKPPGFQPPTSSGPGSTLGVTTATPPPKLPGLGGETTPGGTPDGEIDMFGLDVNAAFGLPPADAGQ
ncbi:MAG: hypothetical protein ABI614_09970 [Planctomycetota bacterium]